jgi:hypothetical protein
MHTGPLVNAMGKMTKDVGLFIILAGVSIFLNYRDVDFKSIFLKKTFLFCEIRNLEFHSSFFFPRVFFGYSVILFFSASHVLPGSATWIFATLCASLQGPSVEISFFILLDLRFDESDLRYALSLP